MSHLRVHVAKYDYILFKVFRNDKMPGVEQSPDMNGTAKQLEDPHTHRTRLLLRIELSNRLSEVLDNRLIIC